MDFGKANQKNYCQKLLSVKNCPSKGCDKRQLENLDFSEACCTGALAGGKFFYLFNKQEINIIADQPCTFTKLCIFGLHADFHDDRFH